MDLQLCTTGNTPEPFNQEDVTLENVNLETAQPPHIQHQVLQVLSGLLKQPAHQIDLDLPITAYGIDSVDAFTAIVDIEEAVGIELPDSIFWDYPTVNSATSYIASLVGGDR